MILNCLFIKNPNPYGTLSLICLLIFLTWWLWWKIEFVDFNDFTFQASEIRAFVFTHFFFVFNNILNRTKRGFFSFRNWIIIDHLLIKFVRAYIVLNLLSQFNERFLCNSFAVWIIFIRFFTMDLQKSDDVQ